MSESEPLAERLSRFTPDGAGLDRDALLFEAGRAAVRPSRAWPAVAAALAACQLLTLGLLWPRPAGPGPVHVTTPTESTVGSMPAPPEPMALSSLSRRVIQADGELPPSAPADLVVADVPPLRAFAARLPAELY